MHLVQLQDVRASYPAYYDPPVISSVQLLNRLRQKPYEHPLQEDSSVR
ncbi:uncharacterized protein METZ01_LOCUS507565 [marine metagenome]|uniref:Uncharacterized protein n=1 Tax=marine metagenome TaxID=408172 RepID=A0A383EDB5_9ZZZZ